MLKDLPYNVLPKNDLFLQELIPINFTPKLFPAPIDMISLKNGLFKFEHNQKCVKVTETAYLFHHLNDSFGWLLASVYGSLVPLSGVPDWLVRDSTPGFPYALIYGTTKEAVLKHRSCEELWSDFLNYTCILSSTLKVELREIVFEKYYQDDLESSEGTIKDARLFRPGCIASIVAAVHMFGFQNQALASAPFETGISLGMSTPGYDFCKLWLLILKFAGHVRSYDGASWDANFQLWMAEIICLFRMKYLPAAYGEKCQRYYSMMYNGVTNVLGNLLHLVANPSGHYNTSIDNSLGEIMNVWLYCYRRGIDEKDIKFFVCGDDLIVTTRTDLFTTSSFLESTASTGSYLTALLPEEVPFYDNVFCGTHPVLVDGAVKYTYDEDKQLSSLCYKTRKSSYEDFFSKLCSITGNLYYSTHYVYLHELCLTFFANFLSSSSRAVGLLKSVDEFALHILYSFK